MSVGATEHEVTQVTKSRDSTGVQSKCVLQALAKNQEFNGKAAFSVKSHSKVQALPLMPDTLRARLCARAHCAVSQMEMIDTKSTGVKCAVCKSSIM